MSLNSSWAPVNATSSELWGERSLLDGILVASVAYGVHLTLFALCFNMLLSTRKKSTGDWFHLVYICVLFVLGTIGNALTSRWCEMVFVDNSNFPGGPNAFSDVESINWVYVGSTSVYIVNLWCADGLLLYRFFTIWKRNLYVTIIPAIALCVTIVLGAMLMYMLPRPELSFPLQVQIQLPVAFWSLSVAYNVLLTLAITGRLMYMRWQIKSTAASVVLTPYVSVSSMLIESAALYTINGLILVISLAQQSDVQALAVPVLGQTQSIGPLMIIYRVLQGKAWSMSTYRSFDNPAGVVVGKSLSTQGGSSRDLSKGDLATNYVNRDFALESPETTYHGNEHQA